MARIYETADGAAKITINRPDGDSAIGVIFLTDGDQKTPPLPGTTSPIA